MRAPLLHVAATQLPEEERRWLDPGVPLPTDVRLLRRVPPTYALVLVFLFVPFALGLVLAGLELSRSAWKRESTLLFPLFTAPFLLVLWLELRLRALGRELAAGRRRLGLFLGPQSALLAMREDECSVVPRARARAPVPLARRTGKQTHFDVGLAFTDDRGGLASLCVPVHEVEVDGGSRALHELVDAWSAPPHPPPPAPSPPAPPPDPDAEHRY